MGFLGEFDVKADAKGRVKIPASLLRQLGDEANSFVVNRGFEGCLVLYTKEQWEMETQKFSQLNMYNKEHRKFLRQLFRGATELTLDASDRVLLPKPLMAYADITKDVVMFAHLNKIEIWDKQRYEDELDVDSDDYADIADSVMSFFNKNENEQ